VPNRAAAAAGLVCSFRSCSSPSQAAHLRLSCPGAGVMENWGSGVRITLSATWSASRSTGSSTGPTSSLR
jgi:hypothetical protein